MKEETLNWKIGPIIEHGWATQNGCALRINANGVFYNSEGEEIKAPLDIEAAFRKALNVDFALSEHQQVIFDYLVENEYNMDDVFTAVGEIGNDYFNCEGYTPIPAIVVAYGELEGDRIAQVICRFLDYQAKKDK
ncbi:hypothetical protein PGRAN_02570 [Listeria grandensis FSL F6-0971]|uniref:Uncharacterized protein n=1 Tax=Listeria grandensis FSL F6-0971 TaxID=1265819 RepID=W7BWQ3_9LIST|nr:hypothetical protein [Listeria grandensis]EUJ24743.1 hypothetical protein PGRAN_02570 [Listeria grandensis FSL F6-0971]